MTAEGLRVLVALFSVFAVTAALMAALVWYAIVFPRQPVTGKLPDATAEVHALAKRLRRHVSAIAGGPRNLMHYEGLEAAAATIERALRERGLEPVAHPFEVEGRPVRNIEVVIGPDPSHGEAATLVVGAHYDSPDDSPGANDNGTGVAALIELAGALAGVRSPTRLRLVFFVNEEMPYGKTEAMGSLRYARALAASGERVRGMIALETIGYFSDEPGSQRFPPPFGLVYPDVGNFVAFVALPGARRLLHQCVRAFRRHARFPSVGGLAPGFVPGIDLSDHWSFHQVGIPALMVTDSAPFRNPYYHELDDRPENVDYVSLARVTLGLAHMLRDLAETG